MRKQRPRIDPELLRQVTEAESKATASSEAWVQAVVFLEPDAGQSSGPADVEQLVSAMLTRVEHDIGEQPHDVNVFRNLRSFVVQAPPRFLRRLVEQPEVRSATANANRAKR